MNSAHEREKIEKSLHDYLERTLKELSGAKSDSNSMMYVAEFDKEIIGFGRATYFNTQSKQVRYPAPSGWYLMGVIIKPEFRRRGVGTMLTKKRLSKISQINERAYFIVNANNQSSMDMHEKMGFVQIEEGEGFLDVKFDGGCGCLYQIEF